jgi:hypothetical protein
MNFDEENWKPVHRSLGPLRIENQEAVKLRKDQSDKPDFEKLHVLSQA